MSNAALWSRDTSTVDMPWSIEWKILSRVRSKAVSQLGRLMKTFEANKGMQIKISRRQLAYNMKIEGGFLPMLAGLIPFLTGTILRALRVGPISWTGRHRCSKTNRKWIVP